MALSRQKHNEIEAVKMKYLEKEKELIEKTKNQIKSIVDQQLRELIKWDPNREFIELELEICKRLNEIGAQLLESLIPQVYGDGYIGPRKNINIDAEYDEDRISYRCESKSRTRPLKTIFGDIKINRAMYSEYFSGGYKSFLDEKLDIEKKKICPLIKYWTDLIGTIAPFDEATDILNKIRGINVSTKQAQISTEEIGAKITKTHDENVKDIQLNDKKEVPAVDINLNLNSNKIVYIETDGCHINTYDDWKECKTFMLFELDKISEDKHRLKNKFYYSTMKSVGEIKRQLKHHIEKYCGGGEVKIVCIADGAKWIWNSMEELFPKRIYPSGIVEIVDWYHAIEKIGDIKKEIFRDEEAGNRFYEHCKENLKRGNIEVIEQTLEELRDKQTLQERKEFVDGNLKYFMNNKEKMRYEKFREQGLCIGSGAIESANKYVVQRRLKLPGMKWNEDNANYMVHLRAEYINKQMDVHYGIKSNPLINDVAVT